MLYRWIIASLAVFTTTLYHSSAADQLPLKPPDQMDGISKLYFEVCGHVFRGKTATAIELLIENGYENIRKNVDPQEPERVHYLYKNNLAKKSTEPTMIWYTTTVDEYSMCALHVLDKDSPREQFDPRSISYLSNYELSELTAEEQDFGWSQFWDYQSETKHTGILVGKFGPEWRVSMTNNHRLYGSVQYSD